LEKVYEELKNERTKLSVELGEVIKPVNQQKAALDAYLSDHMVELTPSQVAGLQNKTEAWQAKIVQINVAEANIVDRCESCHLGIREPVKLTAAAMAPIGKEPDEYARAFTSHPESELLKTHDPDKFGCSPCHQGNGRADKPREARQLPERGSGRYSQGEYKAGCQTCHAADMKLVSGYVEWHVINEGKDLFRQRGCVGCHRYEGYDKEPEDLLSVAQEIKLLDQQKKDNSKQAAYLMKQADAAESNQEANRLNDEAVALRVANSKLDLRIVQLDRSSKSLLQDMKKVGPNLKDVRLKLNKNWIPVWLKKPSDFRATTKMPNFRLSDDQIEDYFGLLCGSRTQGPAPQTQDGRCRAGQRAL
jgi:cytochrome c551/c552